MTEEHKKLHIMIVDDDKFLLDMYVIKFKSQGLTADTFPGSSVALKALRDGAKPDIVLLDVIMPTMDGIELLKTIRAEKLVPDATIIMLTNQPDEIEKAQELNVDGYIIKATSIPSEVVAKVLEIHKSKK